MSAAFLPEAFANRPSYDIICLRKFKLSNPSTILPPSCFFSGRRQPSPFRLQAPSADRTWGGELPDWDLEPYSSDAEVEDALEDSILSPELGGDGGGGEGSPEFAFQNILAALLLGAIGLSMGNILLKLGVVVAALVSAAFRYTAIGFLVLFLIALFS